MATDITTDLASLRFDGKRFEGHALDVECTQELIAYRNLIVECAKELWRRKNPDRARLPRGFEDDFRALPLTGKGVVNLIITDLCVFEVESGKGLVLKELHPGVSLEDVKAKTGADFRVAL